MLNDRMNEWIFKLAKFKVTNEKAQKQSNARFINLWPEPLV
jgi:hypothetical protein